MHQCTNTRLHGWVVKGQENAIYQDQPDNSLVKPVPRYHALRGSAAGTNPLRETLRNPGGGSACALVPLVRNSRCRRSTPLVRIRLIATASDVIMTRRYVMCSCRFAILGGHWLGRERPGGSSGSSSSSTSSTLLLPAPQIYVLVPTTRSVLRFTSFPWTKQNLSTHRSALAAGVPDFAWRGKAGISRDCILVVCLESKLLPE